MESNTQWPAWMVKAVAAKGFVEEIGEHTTTRRCSECLVPATKWKFKANREGGKNKSSRRPVCEAHAK
jgi:hypothetical protein